MVAILIALIASSLASPIAKYWLISNQMSQSELSCSVILMGIVIASRWPIGLYQGVLLGAQRMTLYSGINIAMVTISSLGAIVVLAYVSPSIQAYFLWQGVTGIVYAVVARQAAWRVVGKRVETRFDSKELRRVRKFTIGMALVSLMGFVLSQLDKAILSKVLTLTDFGYYTLATVAASSLYLVAVPVYNIIYPQFSSLVATGRLDKLEEQYRFSSRVLSIFIFPIAIMLAIFAKDLIYLWIGNIETAKKVAKLMFFLAIGSAFNGIMYVPHALQLALGLTRLPIAINAILVLVIVPLTILLAIEYGGHWSAMSWACLHVLYLFIGTALTHRAVLKGIGKKWLFFDLGIPLLLTIIAAFFALIILNKTEYSSVVRVMLGLALTSITIVTGALLTQPIRIYIFKRIQRI
ncbi:MAG: oligosaccharide flippase family protein [Burkholderiales bacterium]|nr:oligosaccharide flippase family protein [Burkholderiales bacterium]